MAAFSESWDFFAQFKILRLLVTALAFQGYQWASHGGYAGL